MYKSSVASVWSYHSQNILTIMDCIGHLVACLFIHSFRFAVFFLFRSTLFSISTTKQIFFTSFIRFISILNITDTGHSALTDRKKAKHVPKLTWYTSTVIGHCVKDDMRKGVPWLWLKNKSFFSSSSDYLLGRKGRIMDKTCSQVVVLMSFWVYLRRQ